MSVQKCSSQPTHSPTSGGSSLGREVVQAEKPVVVSYTYRTVVSRNGHLLHLDVEQPTRGISVELDYTDLGVSIGGSR